MFLFGAEKMKFALRGAVWALGIGTCLTVRAQPYPLIGSRENCVNLSTHAAIQECQARQKAEYKDWEKQSNDRYQTPSLRLNGEISKSPMNCFKREATGEQFCAN